MTNKFIVAIVGFIASLTSIAIGRAATIEVNIPTDEFDTRINATCSLREAIESINRRRDFGGCVASGSYGQNDLIRFAPHVLTVTLSLQTPSPSNDDNTSLDLDIRQPVTIQADSPVTVLAVRWPDRVFDIFATGDVRISALRIAIYESPEEFSNESGASRWCFRGGGAIRSTGNAALVLDKVVITGGRAPQHGGAICTENSLIYLSEALLHDNRSLAGVGGALAAYASRYASVRNSILIGNQAWFGGGGLAYVLGDHLHVEESLIAHNNAKGLSAHGGGIWVSAGHITHVYKTVIARNKAAGYGGGISHEGHQLGIKDSTLILNEALSRPDLWVIDKPKTNRHAH